MSPLHNAGCMCVCARALACVIYGPEGLNDLFRMPFVDNWSMKLCEQRRDLLSPLLCVRHILCVVCWAVGVTGMLNNTLGEGEGGWVASLPATGCELHKYPIKSKKCYTFHSFHNSLANQFINIETDTNNELLLPNSEGISCCRSDDSWWNPQQWQPHCLPPFVHVGSAADLINIQSQLGKRKEIILNAWSPVQEVRAWATKRSFSPERWLCGVQSSPRGNTLTPQHCWMCP